VNFVAAGHGERSAGLSRFGEVLEFGALGARPGKSHGLR
jgi:hypothetical protein